MKKHIVADTSHKTYIVFDAMTLKEVYAKFGKPVPEWVTVCSEPVDAIALVIGCITRKRFNVDKTCESLKVASEKL